jgi:hypothetical protein
MSSWPRFGLLDLIPGLRDLPYKTKVKITVLCGLLMFALAFMIYLILMRH